MRSFGIALRFLTVFPWPRNPPVASQIDQSTPFFPVVGLCLGLLLVLLNRILEPYVESEILGVVLVALLILATRARHLEGVGRTFDGIRLGNQGSSMAEGRMGIFGLLAVLVVVMLKFRAVEVMGEMRNQGLLLAPVLSRWSMVILAYDSGPNLLRINQTMEIEVQGKHLFWASALTLVLSVLLSGRLGLWIVLWVSLLALIAGWYFQRRLDGVTGYNLGAMAEISEAFAMVLFASLY
ncbi:MAG: adenosylcobinamide-GDP ribazoletransferase [Deltaproteobacteria bacterium]|nr:adenosylcobinamide-GDP ribazoletransferase [Deltaproteobacteria bacterium]